jgi:hypothetical protein
MAKAPTKKSVVKPSTPDYFKLPFEVYYKEQIAVTAMEFKSDLKVKKFEDVKIVHVEQGGSWGASFSCSQNNGPELYCCIANLHDEVEPTWLSLIEEDNMDMNSGFDYAVLVENGEIKFVDLTEEQEDEESEDFINCDNMDYCCSWAFFVYELGDSCPEYLILDAQNSRLKVNLNGFVLDDDGNPTDARVFNPDELDSEEYEDYTIQEMWDAKFNWVKSIIEKDFPKQKNKLKLSPWTR